MRAFKKRDTLPELAVRRIAHRLGYRFRLYRTDLPGTPDLVFPARRKVIFVNGCFWHSHGCRLSKLPASNHTYWVPKLRRNKERDQRNLDRLTSDGWSCLVIWECETRDSPTLERRIRTFLG
jgi:DNA mismatch endonuclease (patch repair protein)